MPRIIFFLTILFSLLSQSAYAQRLGISSILSMSWFVTFLIIFLRNPSAVRNKEFSAHALMLGGFIVFGLFAEVVTGQSYFATDFRNMVISFLIVVTSALFWRIEGSKQTMRMICLISLASALLLAIEVYQSFLVKVELSQVTYAYQQKNSMGQILLSCAVVWLLNVSSFSRKSVKAAGVALLVLLIVIIFLMKARATILGGIVALLYVVLRTKRKFLRYSLIVLIIATLVFFLYYPDVYDNIVHSILLNNHSGGKWDDVSSGRIRLISHALKEIPSNFFLGVGSHYLDCMPVAVIWQYGIIGGSIIFAFIYHLSKRVFTLQRTVDIHITTIVLYLITMTNSIFEAYAPFGPGIKCMFFWMFFGFSIVEIQRRTMKPVTRRPMRQKA